MTLNPNNKSFTLIELLIVITIIGVLSAIVITSMSNAVTKSRIVRLQVFSDTIRAQLSDSLVSYWSFNEGTGVTAYDQWEGNNGTLGGGTPDYYPTWKSGGECVSGKCLEFDGDNDYVYCGSNVNVSAPYTIEAWVKIPSTANGAVMVGLGTSGNSCPFFAAYWSSNKGIIYLNGANYKYTGTDVRDNAWHHIVYIIIGDGQDDILNAKSYTDGINTTIAGGSHSVNPIVPSGHCYISSISSTFEGLIDEVRIYNSAVSITQIQSQYLAGLDNLLSNGAISKSEYNQRIKELSKSLVNE